MAAPVHTQIDCYATCDYWEQRYTDDAEPFDFYTTLAVVKRRLHTVLALDAYILHVGNGTSLLPEEMCALNFSNQLSTDCSPSVIDSMRQRTAGCHGLQWAVEDATALSYPPSTFDAVIDKGVYDALAGGGQGYALVAEAWRVLKPGGALILMSSQENAARAFAPMPAGQGEHWVVSSTHEVGAEGECWVHVAHKLSLPDEFIEVTSCMGPLERALVVTNAPTAAIDAAALVEELSLRDRLLHCATGGAVIKKAGVLGPAECSALRDAVNAAALSAASQKSGRVDGALEWQLNLSHQQLTNLIGDEAVARVWACAARHDRALRPAPMPQRAEVPSQARAPECWWVYVRRYSPRTRPFFRFHYDLNLTTVNIALTDDSEHTGGRLIVVAGGIHTTSSSEACDDNAEGAHDSAHGDGLSVTSIERAAGDAVIHGSNVPHAVSCMVGGERMALILFFGRPCPQDFAGIESAPSCNKPHPLRLCAPSTLQWIYRHQNGEYHCDGCSRSNEDDGMGWMWHCCEGCEYDLCLQCHAIKRRVRAWRRARCSDAALEDATKSIGMN